MGRSIFSLFSSTEIGRDSVHPPLTELLTHGLRAPRAPDSQMPEAGAGLLQPSIAGTTLVFQVTSLMRSEFSLSLISFALLIDPDSSSALGKYQESFA